MIEKFFKKANREKLPVVEVGKFFKISVVDVRKLAREIVADRKKKGLDMKIEINAIKIDKHKEISKTITFTKDNTMGHYWGIAIGEHEDGNPKWRKIQLGDRNLYNLENEYDAAMCICVMVHPSTKGSPFAFGDSIFRLLDPDMEAKRSLAKAKLIESAMRSASTMKTEHLRPFARFLGFQGVLEKSETMLRHEIVNFAMSDPEVFEERKKNKDRKIAELVKTAMDHGVIEKDNKDYFFMYNEVQLGLTDVEAIYYLQNDPVILTAVISSTQKFEPVMITKNDVEELKRIRSVKEGKGEKVLDPVSDNIPDGDGEEGKNNDDLDEKEV